MRQSEKERVRERGRVGERGANIETEREKERGQREIERW